MAKNKMKRTYTCVVVNEGSLSNKVNIRATINESRNKEQIFFGFQ
jgi:hypothetical protein